MTYIPNCREDENYNVDKLREQDRDFIRGYDYCTDYAADSFFDKLEMDFGEDSYFGHFLNERLPESMQSSYEYEYLDGSVEERAVETYGDYFRSKMLDFIESQRDELIVSIIDGYWDGDGE